MQHTDSILPSTLVGDEEDDFTFRGSIMKKAAGRRLSRLLSLIQIIIRKDDNNGECKFKKNDILEE